MKKVDIKEIREALKLTQAQFANKLGVQRTYISMVESGAKPLSDRLVKKVELLSKDCVYFSKNEDTKKAPQNETRMDNLENEIKEIKESLETIKNLLLKILAK